MRYESCFRNNSIEMVYRFQVPVTLAQIFIEEQLSSHTGLCHPIKLL